MKAKNIDIKYLQKCKDRNLSCIEIAKESGFTINHIYNACKRNNIQLRKARRGGQNIKDMVGQRFHSLVVQKRDKTKKKLAYWICVCDCGKEFSACGVDIRGGKTKTCGCRVSIKSRRNWKGFEEIPKKYWSIVNNNAHQRNLVITISIEYINELFIKQNRKCVFTGLELSFKDSTASLDRIDSSIGYIKGNVQWVHKDVNMMKMKLTDEYFIQICKLVAEYRNETL